MHDRARLLGCAHRDAVGGLFVAGAAQVHERTVSAARCTVWDAHDRTQLHHRLIERTRAVVRYDSRHLRPHIFFDLGIVDRTLVARNACDHAQDVAIDRRFGNIKGDGRHCARGVISDSRQF